MGLLVKKAEQATQVGAARDLGAESRVTAQQAVARAAGDPGVGLVHGAIFVEVQVHTIAAGDRILGAARISGQRLPHRALLEAGQTQLALAAQLVDHTVACLRVLPQRRLHARLEVEALLDAPARTGRGIGAAPGGPGEHERAAQVGFERAKAP